MLKIEKGIPVPAKEGAVVATMREMEVGDSFFLEGYTQNKVANVRCIYGRIPEKKFTIRKVEGGYRCWRFE